MVQGPFEGVLANDYIAVLGFTKIVSPKNRESFGNWQELLKPKAFNGPLWESL